MVSRTAAQYAFNCWEHFHFRIPCPFLLNNLHSCKAKEREGEPIWAGAALICSISVLSSPRNTLSKLNVELQCSEGPGDGKRRGGIIESRISKALNTPGWYIITHKLDLQWPFLSPLGSVLQRAPRGRRPLITSVNDGCTRPCMTDFIKISSSIHHIDQTARPSPIMRKRNRVRREEDRRAQIIIYRSKHTHSLWHTSLWATISLPAQSSLFY